MSDNPPPQLCPQKLTEDVSEVPSQTRIFGGVTFDATSADGTPKWEGLVHAPQQQKVESAPEYRGEDNIMAGLRADYPLLPRHSMQSTTSNSVPSTPLQQPRDIRFHSRSPSPHRRLSNQSPRSVVSEAVGGGNTLNGLGLGLGIGGVCRFETGAEIRKRRIPYVDGGNEELGPPKKEPKKTLEPDEREKLTGDMRELYDRLLPSDESEQRRAKLVQKLGRILNEEYSDSEITVKVFGSSGNLLSSSDSDVDICITTPKRLNMHALADLLHKHGMENVVCRASAKVPIVKCWDPELKLATDLNVNNTLALENTRMIKTYVQLDARVRPLAKIIKYWTKRRILNDAAFGGTISSYTWICMIISFLQRRDPPILPSLQKANDCQSKRGSTDASSSDAGSELGERSRFTDDIDQFKGFGDANEESQADLLFQFFRHYAYEFEYSKDVVSIREGRLLSRKEKGWDPSNYADKEARNRLCVEEPFTVNRNLGNSADDYAWSGIHAEIRRAFELLADGCQLEKCCEQFEFPPEEQKPVFQRPTPKPKPTLTRSASQSGRSGQENGSVRQRKPSNRNQSSQRMGNRRASSGATFSSHRLPLAFQSPSMGAGLVDYFGGKGTLHEQLAQQYQLLQAQQEVLQRRLSQQQQVTRVQGQAGDLAASPHHMGRSFTEGLASPRLHSDSHSQSSAPLTAPLMPGYPYQYVPRYPLPSPMLQARPREGSNTSPSSPSLMAAIPALRRQVHRAPTADGSSTSVRSQSQPGRSLPHPLTMPQYPPPGYEFSGAYGPYPLSAHPSQRYSHTSPFPQMPFTPLTPLPTLGHSIEAPMPKEYVGYYVGQSPRLGPQYATGAPNAIPPVTLRDPPRQRQRRVTPDLMTSFINGRRTSRSPSPLGRTRSSSTYGDLHTAQNQTPIFQRLTPFETLQPGIDAVPSMAPPRDVSNDANGPLIVNGSNTGGPQKLSEKTNGSLVLSPAAYDDQVLNSVDPLSRIPYLPVRGRSENIAPHDLPDAPGTPSRVSPSSRQKPGPRLHLSSPNGSSTGKDGVPENFHETTPIQAPLLSPVAELRTPSPTHSGAFEKDSPQANGLMRAAHIASAKQANLDSPLNWPNHERKGSTPNPIAHTLMSTANTSALPSQPQHTTVDKNPWQQAPGRKGHKKSRSSLGGGKVGVPGPNGGSFGQPLPANENERKGG